MYQFVIWGSRDLTCTTGSLTGSQSPPCRVSPFEYVKSNQSLTDQVGITYISMCGFTDTSHYRTDDVIYRGGIDHVRMERPISQEYTHTLQTS